MKIYILICVLLLFPSQIFSAPCPENSLVEEAKTNWLNRSNDIYDIAVGNPSDSRAFSNCLSSVEALGDLFSMGINLPTVDGILEKVCTSLDIALKNALDEAKKQVQTYKQDILNKPVFSVVLNPQLVVNEVIGKLK